MYIVLSFLVSFLMVICATLQLALWQFWVLYPIYCFVVFKAVDGIPFWRLNESKLANFLTKMFFFGGLPWYYLIIIIVNIVWWQAGSKAWLYHFADSAWRLLAPALDKPDLVFSTLINTEHADFSQKAKLMYSLFLLFFLLISPFFLVFTLGGDRVGGAFEKCQRSDKQRCHRLFSYAGAIFFLGWTWSNKLGFLRLWCQVCGCRCKNGC